MFDNETFNKLLNRQKKVISGFEWHWAEMQKKGHYFKKKMTVELLEKLWALEDMHWQDLQESLDEALKRMKEKNKTHQDIDQLINNHQRVKKLQLRERKHMLWKIKIQNEQRMEKKKKKEEKEKAANENTSLNLDEGAKDDSGKTKTQQSVEKDATEDLAWLECNEMTVSQEMIISTSSTEIVPSVSEGDTEQLDAPSEQLTVADKEVHEDNVSTITRKRKRGRPHKLQAKSPGTPLTASHENEGLDPSAASVVKSAQMKEVSSPISINTESPVQDSQDASKEKAEENLETRTDASARKLLDIVSDDQASERRLEAVTCDMNAENLPFVKRTPLWHTIEAMEAFQKIPQNPHFRPLLEGVKESAREGLAIATMVTFSTVVDRIYRLRFEDPRSTIEDCLETLVELESNGFNVEVIRDCLTHLLLLKDKQEELEDQSKGVVEKIEEQKIQEKLIDDEVDEIDRQIRQVGEKRRKVLVKKEEWNLEVVAMKTTVEAIEQKIIEVAAEFDRLAAPL